MVVKTMCVLGVFMINFDAPTWRCAAKSSRIVAVFLHSSCSRCIQGVDSDGRSPHQVSCRIWDQLPVCLLACFH